MLENRPQRAVCSFQMCKKRFSVLLRRAAGLLYFLLENKPVNPTLGKATYHTSGGWIWLEPPEYTCRSSHTTSKGTINDR